MSTKQAFHELIDKIQNEKLLKGYFELIKRLNTNQTGKLWDALNAEEKDELLLSFEESFEPSSLLRHQDVKSQHDKWLKE
jgi:hypothetical protein